MDTIDELNRKCKDKSVHEILSALAIEYKDSIVFSTSFGIEDQVITDMIFSKNIPATLFTIDTGRLFPEIFNVFNRTLDKYQKPIKVYFPNHEPVETLLTKKGPFSFYQSVENRLERCQIRKIEPLKRALFGNKIWITGLRAEQSPYRNELMQFEFDQKNNLIKYHPLLHWTGEQVRDYINQHNIPYNVLHDRGFVSIGCAPCTRAVKNGEDFRAGRWWWENNSKKECGLHSQNI